MKKTCRKGKAKVERDELGGGGRREKTDERWQLSNECMKPELHVTKESRNRSTQEVKKERS